MSTQVAIVHPVKVLRRSAPLKEFKKSFLPSVSAAINFSC